MINFNKKQNKEIEHAARILSQHNTTKSKINIENTMQNKNYQQIMLKIRDLDEQNKKLISISNNIMTTTFYKNQKTSFPTIISQMETEMKNAFNQLILSIQQYYVDIDTKIKDICICLTTFQNESTSSRQSHPTQNHISYSQLDKFAILTKKVESLQQNLKRTQQNEKNLISVIDKLLEKYQPTEQVTIIREDPILNNKIKNMKQINQKKKNQKSNNISLDKNAFLKSKEKLTARYNIQSNKNQRSFHQDLNSVNSYGTDQLLSARNSLYSDYNQDKCFIKKLYSKPGLCAQKLSLKSNTHANKHNFQFIQKNQYIEQSNKTHREDYLMRNLKR